MKKLLIALICVSASHVAFAQKELLQLDETNKYVYYQVVDKPGVVADTLYNRSLTFAKTAVPKTKPQNVVANAVVTKGKFLVYSGSSVVRKEGGEVSYTLFIESKDQKYRYKVSDLIFTPYARDRFGNMVAIPGVEVPLEKLTIKYSQKEADNYLAQTGAFCKQTGETLKRYMDKLSNIRKVEPVKKVATDKW
ncbi:DUF4468 domain-containing protein [Mucilaginibacter glaciei]|uniref:DUF4468 domain-containing protein n=1 Tax=Mucilaginibacter glaciei TaxID=2772109 RepID=A0A926NMB7_9SPHI|nr:DUF4468 domain-containing protein [Mucilaginibacter glaciei]MBD1391848.1 DUF4468 domain-containing protein [Mucilaginibacter glaciei]